MKRQNRFHFKRQPQNSVQNSVQNSQPTQNLNDQAIQTVQQPTQTVQATEQSQTIEQVALIGLVRMGLLEEVGLKIVPITGNHVTEH